MIAKKNLILIQSGYGQGGPQSRSSNRIAVGLTNAHAQVRAPSPPPASDAGRVSTRIACLEKALPLDKHHRIRNIICDSHLLFCSPSIWVLRFNLVLLV